MEGLLFQAGRALASCRRDSIVKSLYLPFWNGQSTENRRTIDGETAKGQLSEHIVIVAARSAALPVTPLFAVSYNRHRLLLRQWIYR